MMRSSCDRSTTPSIPRGSEYDQYAPACPSPAASSSNAAPAAAGGGRGVSLLAERAGGGARELDCRELSGLSALEEESVLLCRRFRLAERARARRALYALSGVLDSPSLPSSEVFCDLRGARGRSGRIGRGRRRASAWRSTLRSENQRKGPLGAPRLNSFLSTFFLEDFFPRSATRATGLSLHARLHAGPPEFGPGLGVYSLDRLCDL